MKKALCVAMALMMTASMSTAAFAEDAGSSVDNPIQFDYHDIDETVYDGVWYATGLGFDVYLPDTWTQAELTDEMTEAGVAFMAGDEETGANMVISVGELPEEAKDYDLEQLGVELAASNTTALYADLSGIPAVIFENDDTEISGFSMLTETGYLISGVMSAPRDVSYDDYGPFFYNMTLSISPSEQAETETE